MDLDALVRTLGHDGCIALGLAVIALCGMAAVVAGVLIHSQAEFHYRERRETQQLQAQAARRQDMERVVEHLRNCGLNATECKNWISLHGL